MADERRQAQMSGHGEKFGRRREQAIVALLASGTLAEAATSCGIATSTLRRWLRDPEFTQRYQAERSRLLEAAVNLLRKEATAAARTLATVSADTTAPASARVSGARAVLDLVLRAAELQDIEERIAALETVAGQR
jgi:hypothetical protein